MTLLREVAEVLSHALQPPLFGRDDQQNEVCERTPFLVSSFEIAAQEIAVILLDLVLETLLDSCRNARDLALCSPVYFDQKKSPF